MRNSIRFAAVTAALASAISFGSAAHAATTATATARAEILSSLTVTNTAGLNFGQIASNTGGTITIATGTATNSCSSGLVCTGTPQKATFTVTGTQGVGVRVTLPTDPVVLTQDNPPATGTAATMSATAFTSYFPLGTSLQGSGASGTADFEVGATLAVAAGQAVDTYTGTFSVSVEYQ